MQPKKTKRGVTGGHGVSQYGTWEVQVGKKRYEFTGGGEGVKLFIVGHS